MKKLFVIALSVLLVLGFSTIAIAADFDEDTAGLSVDIPVVVYIWGLDDVSVNVALSVQFLPDGTPYLSISGHDYFKVASNNVAGAKVEAEIISAPVGLDKADLSCSVTGPTMMDPSGVSEPVAVAIQKLLVIYTSELDTQAGSYTGGEVQVTITAL